MKTPEANLQQKQERKYPFHVEVEVWGPYAMFTRPELIVERWSYDVPTVSFCRNLLQTIYWHPPFQFQIKEIEVINPVKRITMTRNELDTQISSRTVNTFIGRLKERMQALWKEICKTFAKDREKTFEERAKELGITIVPDMPALKASETRQQRSSTLLKDVRYIIRADIVPSKKRIARDEPFDMDKILGIFHERLEKGSCYTSPFMGIREYPAYVKKVDPNNKPVSAYKGTTVDLGTMLYDIDYDTKDKPQPYFYHPIMVDGVIKVPDEREVMKDAARRA